MKDGENKKEMSRRVGKRTGSGQKLKYNEETKTVVFRCPLSKIDDIKALINNSMSKWSVK